MTSKASLTAHGFALIVVALALPLAQTGHAQTDPSVDYATEIQPFLADYCYACHGPRLREANLRLDVKQLAFRDRGGYYAIVPGKPDESEVYLRINSEFAEDRMPPYSTGVELSADQKDLVKRWIEQGAEWGDVDQSVERTQARARRRAGGIPAVELPTEPFIINTHEIPEVKVSVIARGISHPWSLAFLPRGDMLITERSGNLRMVRDGVLVPEPVSGVPTDILARGLSGLMEVAVHPRFEENRLIYLSYTRKLPTVGTVAVVRGRLDGTALRDVEDVFVADEWIGEVPADNPSARLAATAAARLAFAPDGKLFMTMGGAFGVEREDGTASFFGNAMLAQDLSSHAGKLLRLDDDGTAPADNPFVGRAGAKPEIYSMGHRNQQGLAVHPESGAPWAVEHAPQGGDELNAIEAGGNYGWPVVSYGRHYDGPRIAKRFWQEGMNEPVVFWVPSIAPSGLTFYTGDRFPQWKGNLFVGALMVGRIPRTGHLQRIVLNENGEELRREMLLTEYRQRIRDVRQGPDGLLYLLTEEDDGALLKLEPVEN